MSYFPVFIHEQLQAVYAICKKQAEEQWHLITLQNQLDMEQKLANIGSWYYDVLENRFCWSRQMHSIFGVKEHSGFLPSYDKVLEFVHPDDQEYMNQTVKQAINRGDSYSIKYRLIQPNGDLRIVFEKADPVMNEQNQVVQLLGVLYDVTEIHHIKNSLSRLNRGFL
ncbi:PAS domain-containing protein [Priestia flexa]